MTTDAFIYLHIYLEVAIGLDKVTTETCFFVFKKKTFSDIRIFLKLFFFF